MEGGDRAQAFQHMGGESDAYTQWFVQQVHDIHGVDLRQPPPGSLPEFCWTHRPGKSAQSSTS